MTHDLWPLGAMRRRAGAPESGARVVQPASVEEVAEILRSASRVIPAGGLSGVCGAVDAGPDDVVMDLTQLQARAIDEHNLTVRAEAGVNGRDLEEELNRRGLTLGHFPSSLPITTVGGLISTRSSGQLSTYYGNVEDLVVSLTVMLPDGTVCTARPGPRSAVGPKLDELFIGAEGGLGVVLEALLRVHRLPERVIGRGYDFESIDAGLEAMRRIVQRDIRPYVMRLYDHEDTAFQHSDARGCLLVVATAGATGVAEAAAAVVGAECEAATDLGEAPFERWHDHRFSLSAELLEGMLANAGSFVDTIEVAAAWDRLPGLHARVKEVLAVQGLGLCHFSHAYPQGCCAYFTFAGSAASEPEAEAAYEGCWRGTMEAALAAEATIGHHHGAGQVRAPWVQAEMGGWWQVWQKVRSALDPSGTMNPHAVGGAPPPPA